MLAEQQSKANIPPAYPGLEDKAPELEQGKSNKDSSPVLKRDVKDSQIMEETQSNSINGSVSTSPRSTPEIVTNKSTSLKVKKLRYPRHKLRRK